MTIKPFLIPAFWCALIFALVMALLPHPPEVPGHPSDKIQHILAFTVLSGLAPLAYPRLRLLRIVVGLSLFGAMIELLQGIPALHRDSDVIDWIVDTIAISTVIIIVSLIRGRPGAARRSDGLSELVLQDPAEKPE
jgi:VanZ family protein